jgi:nicotinamidase/pyrazinamidase
MSLLAVLILILGCIPLAVIVAIAAGLAYIALPARGPSIGRYENPNKAVLVIDVQEDFTINAGNRSFSPDTVECMIATVNRVVERAHGRGIPVIYNRQEFDNLLTIWLSQIGVGGLGIKGQPGTRLDPRVCFILGSANFTKPRGDAFSNPKLDAYLRAQRVNDFYLMGLDGIACVNRTAQGALNRSYRVNFIMD